MQETDPFTNQVEGVMITAAWAVPWGEVKEETYFGLICKNPLGFTIALVTSDPFEEGYGDWTYRFDQGSAVRISGGVRSTGTEMVLLAPLDLRKFVAGLASATNLAIRIGSAYTYQFKVTGFAEAYKYIGFGGLNGCPGAPTLP